MKKYYSYIPHLLAGITSIVFLDSLRFKFTNHPNTQTIFGKLSEWVTSLGLPDLFAQNGLFSQYVIGSAELVAVILLLLGITKKYRVLQSFGFLLAFGIMSGAVSFHLFTPLGIDPNNDGGGLFAMALFIWVSSGIMVFKNRQIIITSLSTLLAKIKG